MPSSKGSSQPRDQRVSLISCIGRRVLDCQRHQYTGHQIDLQQTSTDSSLFLTSLLLVNLHDDDISCRQLTHSSLQPTHRMQVKTYYSDQFFLSTDVRSMSYCPIYWKVISLPTSKVFNFSLWRRSLQVGNVFKHRQLSFQLISWVFLSSNWSALRVSIFLPCELTCSPTRDTGLEVPLPTGLACSPRRKVCATVLG